jgi:hypothetical protein
MAKLLNASAGFKRTNVTNYQAMLYMLPFIGFEISLLTVFSIVDPPRQTEVLGVGVGIGVQQVTCEHKSSSFYVAQTTYGGKSYLLETKMPWAYFASHYAELSFSNSSLNRLRACLQDARP